LDLATVVLPGLVVLGALAWVIGRVDADARDGAWRRIAAARRHLHEQERDLWECLTGDACPDCPLRRHRT
ncbi:MAG TPA: hypothetical protein VGE11_23205, partial [Pseudonocardia sp.]